MEHLIWDDRLATGDPVIDDQHAQLHDLVMELGIIAEQGEDRVLLGEALFEIIAYAGTHFRAEEELMESVGYPELDRQRGLHQEFAADLAMTSERFGQGDLTVNAAQLRDDLHHWLRTHVWEEDMKLATYLRSRGN